MNDMIIQNLRSQFVISSLPLLVSYLLSFSRLSLFPFPPSFPRRRESIQLYKPSFPRRWESTLLALWIPAYAGMTKGADAVMKASATMLEGAPISASMVKTQ